MWYPTYFVILPCFKSDLLFKFKPVFKNGDLYQLIINNNNNNNNNNIITAFIKRHIAKKLLKGAVH